VDWILITQVSMDYYTEEQTENMRRFSSRAVRLLAS
jgi:hypothetical protein